MGVSVNNLLDISILANGKLFDIYWEMSLTGSELKILRYVFNHCLRLYKTLKFFPKGKDGSPRFWRGKEKMADDCKVSYPTFRNSIRRLSELGLVTSMDSEDLDSEELYCVGLSSEFLNNSKDYPQTENFFRSPTLYNLIGLVYDRFTFESIKDQNNLDNLPFLFTSVKRKPCGAQGLYICSESHTSGYEDQTTKKTKIVRKPIKIKRTPIMTLPASIRIQSAQQKLKLLQNVRTPYEKRVLEVCEYYEYKCRQAIHSSGFKALSKDFRNHKNWKFFVKIYELCKENHWDYKVYIDAQFDRVRFWNRNQLYPYANQFTSEGAIKYYHGYVKDYKEKHSVTGESKVKSGEIKTIQQQIAEDIVKDCDSIAEYIKKAAKRRVYSGMTAQEIKISYLSEHWMGLSVSYLATIPWFLRYLDQFPKETYLTELKQEIQAIQGNKRVFNLTTDIVNRVEGQMEIPKTPTI